MNFVKSQIYKQQITKHGIKETVKDVRSKEELEEIERLKKLPEFQNKDRFLSLPVQLERNEREQLNEREVYYDNDLHCNDELPLINNTDQPYLKIEDGLYSNVQSSIDPSDYQTQQISEMENMKKEYEETKNNILKKKKIEKGKEMEKQKEKEECLLYKELKILKEAKKSLHKEKKIVKHPPKLFPGKSFIKVKPNQKDEKNNTNKEEPIQLKKINKDINNNNRQKVTISLVSGYSDESD